VDPVNPPFDIVLAELHTLVKKKSSVPKVAEAIGMNYYSLRDNLLGKTDIRLSTVYAVLEAIGVSWDELMKHAQVTAAQAGPSSPRP